MARMNSQTRWIRNFAAIVATSFIAFYIINETLRFPPERSMRKRDTIKYANQNVELFHSTLPKTRESQTTKSNYHKVILLWTSFFLNADFHFGFGSKPFVQNNCEEKRCEITKDRDRLNDADVVIFHGADIRRNKTSASSIVKHFDFPPFKRKGQKWVFLNLESPSLLPIVNPSWPPDPDVFGPIFNLTMTYRLDSDIPIPYGFVVKKKRVTLSEKKIDYAANKTKLVAWFVSNCQTPSKREKYVEQLRRHIPVDIYGKCGEKKCSKKREGECDAMLTRDYKFFLSFENSLCRDYITHKLWKKLEWTTAVPVVLGGADYATQAPPGSYIEAIKFHPQELANYLKNMDDKTYNRFHDWRKDHEVRIELLREGFCRLCDYLHKQNDKGHRWYEKLSDVWSNERDCYPQLMTWD